MTVAHRGSAADPSERISDATIEDGIFGLLAIRRSGATLCPSEVARALVPDGGRWRELMPRVRQVAQRLVEARRLRATRGGVPVDATSRGGPVRLGRPIEPDGGGGR